MAVPTIEQAGDTTKTVEQIQTSALGETILVVEDDADVRSYTVCSLRDLGYAVLEAADAASALSILDREAGIQLLLTDLGLPGGTDGRALAEQAQTMTPSLKVLITTAYAASALVHDGRLDPGVELLSKPFTLASLASRIRELLNRDDDAVGQGARILVVEDELLLRMFVVDLLTEAGYRVEEAASFSQAVAKIEEVGSELAGAVVDLGLPDRPGDELVHEIWAVRPNLPVVLATGLADTSVRERVAQDERVRILTKPFQPDALVAMLQRLGAHVDTRA
jgi:CheY-like chemotaxis protein